MVKTKKRHYMKGGVVNKVEGGDNFASIVKMIAHPKCKISLISDLSLKGFVVMLHVEGLDPVEFYGLNETTHVFDVPVDTLVIKMAILYTGTSTADNKLELPPYKAGMRKQMENLNDFQKEAAIQSEIYYQTLSKGNPICPALIDLSHFTSLDSSARFLKALRTKCIDSESRSMITYIMESLPGTTDRQLGMITMESAVTFDTFYDAFDSYSTIDTSNMQISGYDNITASTEQVSLCGDVVFQIARLFNECKIVHCDLHGENILVDKLKKKMLIIDFGRTLHADALSLPERKVAHGYARDLLNSPVLFNSRGNFETTSRIKYSVSKFDVTYLKVLLEFVVSLEYMYNAKYNKVIGKSKIKTDYMGMFELTVHALPTYTAIVRALNAYYSSDVLCSISEKAKYKKVVAAETHDDTQRFETLCERMERLTAAESAVEVNVREVPTTMLSVSRKRRQSLPQRRRSRNSMGSRASRKVKSLP